MITIQRTCILHGVELPRSFWCFVFCWCDRIPNEPRLNVYSVPTFTRHEGRDFLWGVRSLPFSLQPFASESFEQCSKPPLANGFASYRHQFNGDYGPYQYWNRSPLEPPSISQVFRKAQVFQWTLIWWLRILLWSGWPVLATSRLHTGGGCSFLVIFFRFLPQSHSCWSMVCWVLIGTPNASIPRDLRIVCLLQWQDLQGGVIMVYPCFTTHHQPNSHLLHTSSLSLDPGDYIWGSHLVEGNLAGTAWNFWRWVPSNLVLKEDIIPKC